MNATENRHRRTPVGLATLIVLVGLTPLAGCIDQDDDETIFVEVDTVPPAAPTGVVSTTGDREVRLRWNVNTEPDLDGYRIYWSADAEGPYELMASTRVNRFVDHDVDNGVTYFYAVTAVDFDGNESELSYDLVHDTPRPEGFNLVLWDSMGPNWDLSGYDFSAFVRRPFDATGTDVYFGRTGGRPVMIAADDLTDLQDAGFVELDALDWAPPAGWTTEDRVTLIEGHSYYVWTRNDHFAKFRVIGLDPGRVTIDWAYQIDKANPELLPPRGGK
jgi:hypothetical protein